MKQNLVLILLISFVLVGCSKPMGEQKNEVFAGLTVADSVSQVLRVEYISGSQATAEFYVKEDGLWTLKDSCLAYVGQNGLGKEKEGDRKTPIGEFTIGTAFGILPNPGTEISYLEVTNNHFACDEETYYNQIIDTAVVHHANCSGEHMINYVPAYNYGLSTSYNEECIVGKGSAIFVHCYGKNPYTAGCVALPEDFMKMILVTSDKNLVVSIH